MSSQDSIIYKTSDFNLASYLYAKWLEYKQIENRNSTERCTFIFQVPITINFEEILKEWHSPKTDFLRTFAHKAKLLRTEIKEYFNTPTI